MTTNIPGRDSSKATPSPWIAERAFMRRDVTGGRVVVHIGCPEPDPSGIDWRCPFEILGLDNEINDFGFGIDTVGALQNTLRVVRLLLLRSKVPLMWELTKTNDIGFPMAAPTGYGIRFQRRLERHMEAEVKKQGREAQRKARKKPQSK